MTNLKLTQRVTAEPNVQYPVPVPAPALVAQQDAPAAAAAPSVDNAPGQPLEVHIFYHCLPLLSRPEKFIRSSAPLEVHRSKFLKSAPL